MIDSNDPVDQFIKLLENPRVQALLDKIVEKKVNECLLTSELKPIKRVAELEKVTGVYQFEEWEEHEPIIPERIEAIEERLTKIEINPPSVIEPGTIIHETKTEARAVFLVEYLEKEGKERNGQVSLNGNEIKDVLTKVIPAKDPALAPKKGQNLRKIKKDVLAKVKKIFGNQIEINNNKHGRHETRILLRSYPNVT